MPDGLTEISKQGFHAARMRQVWEAVTSAHKVQQDIRAKGAEGIKLDELMDVSDINTCGIGFGTVTTPPIQLTSPRETHSFPGRRRNLTISSLPPATTRRNFGVSSSRGTMRRERLGQEPRFAQK